MLTTPGRRPRLFTSPTLWLVLMNIGAWVYLGMHGVDWMSPNPRDLTARGANLGPYTLTGDWQRLVTSMFLHHGALHLGLNMLMLSLIGPLCEAAWGRIRFTLIYLLSGLFSGLASAWWFASLAVRNMGYDLVPSAMGFTPHFATTVSAGASGALLGASGALLVHALCAGNAAKIELKVIFQVVALNIGMGFLVAGTDNAGHIGGALAGIAIGALLMLPGRVLRIGPAVQSAVVFAVSLGVLVVLVRQPPSDQVSRIAHILRASEALAAQRDAARAVNPERP